MRREEYISDEDVVKRANEAVRIELEKKKALNIPAVAFDRKTRTIYQINSDGTKVAVEEKIRRERYSERNAEEA